MCICSEGMSSEQLLALMVSTLVPNSVMNCFRTVCPFRLNEWDVSYNGKGRSVLFCKNGTIIL